MYKRIIKLLFDATDTFNKEWHDNIEKKVIEASKQFHKNDETSLDDRNENIKKCESSIALEWVTHLICC